MSHLKGRDFLALTDYTSEELSELLQIATFLKQKHKNGESPKILAGKTLGMLFEKHSTRTRVSFAVAMTQMGGQTLPLLPEELQISRGETLSDTGKVLSRYLDALLIRTYEHVKVELWASECSIPIINGLTDLAHPTQALADFLTLQEIYGELKGLKLAYVGDGNNMLQSLLIGSAKLGIHLYAACPPEYQPSPDVLKLAQKAASLTGADIIVTTDPYKATTNADAIYTDVWTSMGQESENAVRESVLKPYQVNQRLLSAAKSGAVFLHCLPCNRGQEVTAEVVDGSSSVVFDQAENRLHAHKAILAAVVAGFSKESLQVDSISSQYRSAVAGFDN